MARWTEHKRETIDAVVDQWREECLQEDGSLLFEMTVWTEANLDRIYERFNKNPLTDDRQFEEKLKEQVGDDPDLVRLGAEILGVYFLFTSGVHAARKRELIGEVLGWIEETFDSAQPVGFANPFRGFVDGCERARVVSALLSSSSGGRACCGRSCISPSVTSSRSSRCWPGRVARRSWRSWSCGTSWRSCVGKRVGRSHTQLTGRSSRR